MQEAAAAVALVLTALGLAVTPVIVALVNRSREKKEEAAEQTPPAPPPPVVQGVTVEFDDVTGELRTQRNEYRDRLASANDALRELGQPTH